MIPCCKRCERCYLNTTNETDVGDKFHQRLFVLLDNIIHHLDKCAGDLRIGPSRNKVVDWTHAYLTKGSIRKAPEGVCGLLGQASAASICMRSRGDVNRKLDGAQ